MTRIYFCIAIMLGMLLGLPTVSAGTLDTDGYPIMYLRGEQTDSWAAQDAYKFSRSGDTYTLHLESLNGEFKISDDDWQLNYGSSSITNISTSMAVPAEPNGPNFNAMGLTDVTIVFDIVMNTYGSSLSPTTIKITATGSGSGSGSGGSTITDGASGTLPLLHINVYQTDATGEFILDIDGNKIFDNSVIDKDLAHKNYFKGEYWLDVNDCQWLIDQGAKSVGSAEEPLALQIKARGNYTRKAFAKKPFKLKLDKKQNLLNMNINGGKSKHWAILAGADDNMGYLRNIVGFNLGERIGLPWTPRQQPVEVIINGDYRGLYFLTESIRVGDGRVPVEELDDNCEDRTLVSGGYLIELDNYDEPEESQIQMAEKGQSDHFKDLLRITFNTPEVYSALQRRFVKDQFTAINDLIGENSDDMWRYIDIDDLARYYIVEEVISHTESFHGSTYMFRDRGEGQKWHFSPLWDCGNAFNGYTDAYFYDCDPFGNTWIPSLRMNDTFNAKVKETWQWFMGAQGGYQGIVGDIDTFCQHVAEAAKADAKRWQGAPAPYGGRDVADNSDMESRRDAVVRHLNAKVNWLAQQADFGQIGGNYAEPARDTTEAMPLPSYAREPNPENIISAYFIDDTATPWTTVSAYVYGASVDGVENNEIFGIWPGSAMEPTIVDGKAAFKIVSEPEHKPAENAKIIFNSEQGSEQSSTFTLVSGNVYYRSGKQTGVDAVVVDAEMASEYYDVMGRKVAEPVAGGVYIVRTGDKVSKVIR